jgi:PIN domain nuclease of toxin-antitoxin system
MKLLLDSHSFLWFCEGSPSLSPAAQTAIEDSRNEVWVSHATAWELAIKISLKKLDLKVPYEELFPGAVVANGFGILNPDFRHYLELLSLPLHHRDPFDRLLIAQAKCDRLTLVSCDPKFAGYGVPVLW